MYYLNKIETLKDIFGTQDVFLETDCLIAGDRRYPIVNDVIILASQEQRAVSVKKSPALESFYHKKNENKEFAEDIQFTFGEEWKTYDKILPEHEKEFTQYFDLVDLKSLQNARVCDLGCGMGRWSYFLRNNCREIILVDFSDSIFTARKNLAGSDNCLFFMCDLKKLPFRNDFCDFLFSLGVLHHLPTNCIDEVGNLKKFAKVLLIFLYYSLDNRSVHFRVILGLVTFVRKIISKIRSSIFRKMFSVAVTFVVYIPLIFLGRILKPFKLSSHVPIYDFYNDKSAKRIEQDVYDRFFTRIEQRVSRKEILTLKASFSEILISNNLPYWHFLCRR